MKICIFNFLNENSLTCPNKVNSLIVSAFLQLNNICPENKFLQRIAGYDFPSKDTLTKKLIVIISDKSILFDFETLIQLFEFVISPSNRIINGAIYTPKNIRTFIIRAMLKRQQRTLFRSYKFADLSCGCGAFLIDIAKELKLKTNLTYYQIFKESIYGVDIEEYAIERSKILLTLLAIAEGEDADFQFNLLVKNSLTFNWKSYIPLFSGFDVIVGNPPYVTVKHMTDETRQHLATMQTCQIGSPDLYIPFFEIGIKNLSSNGRLGFITMNSFFKSLNARNLRQYFQNQSLELKIIDFGAEQIFQSRNTYTCICILNNNVSSNIQYSRILPSMLLKKLKFHKVPYLNLDAYNGWNLYANEVIKKIEDTGTPLGKKYKTSHGLATLKNNVYIFTPYRECDNFYYLKAKNGTEYPIEKTICMTVINSNKLSRKATISSLKEKLIFPYTNEKHPKILEEKLFQKKYPLAYRYLAEHKYILSLRDKGKGKYQTWYAFGRTQGLEQIQHKMFFPKYSDIIPHYLIYSDTQTYFYNGQAFLANSVREMKILKKILESRLFWFYISSTSKPYASNYFSLNGTYIKNFGICNLTEEDEKFILKETDRSILDNFFEKKYQINFNTIIDS